MTRHFTALMGAGAAALAWAAPATAELSFCNDTGISASIAIGYLGGDQWTSEGWWNAGAGECVTVVDAPAPQAFYYWHAVNENGEFVSEDYYFCAVDDVFTIIGDSDCAARGHDRISFNEVQIGGDGALEIRLTAALAPQAPSLRKSPEPAETAETPPQKSQETAALTEQAPEPAPEPVTEPVTEPDPAATAVSQPTLSLVTDIPVADLLTSAPLDFPAIKTALTGDWTQDGNPDLTTQISRDRFEDFQNGAGDGQGNWRLGAACPGHPGEGMGVIITYDANPDQALCMVLDGLTETSFMLRDPQSDETLSYSR